MPTRTWPASVTTRPWRYPPPDGYTMQVITDMHNVVPATAGYTRCESLLHDLAFLPASETNVMARIITGDAIHNMNSGDFTPQKTVALSVFSQLTASDSAPLVYTVGNHEVHFDSGATVASAFGLPSLNYTVDVGPFRYVCYGPANDAEAGGIGVENPWVVPSGTITWIINAIETAPADKRVILVTHCPVSEQYLDDLQDYYLTPKTTFTSILADHSNIIAVFSGHRHHFFQDTETIKVVDFTNHSVALINGGCCGGDLPPSNLQTGHPVQAQKTNGSVFATYYPPNSTGGHRWEARWRDHSIGMWGTPSTGTTYMETLSMNTPVWNFGASWSSTATMTASLKTTARITSTATASSSMTLAQSGNAALQFDWATDSSMVIAPPARTAVRTFGYISV